MRGDVAVPADDDLLRENVVVVQIVEDFDEGGSQVFVGNTDALHNTGKSRLH